MPVRFRRIARFPFIIARDMRSPSGAYTWPSGTQGSGSWPWHVLTHSPSTHRSLGPLQKVHSPPPMDVSAAIVELGPVLDGVVPEVTGAESVPDSVPSVEPDSAAVDPVPCVDPTLAEVGMVLASEDASPPQEAMVRQTTHGPQRRIADDDVRPGGPCRG